MPKYKHSPKFHGPYIIKDNISNHNYIVHINGEDKIVNISKMKPYKLNKFSQLPSKPGMCQNDKNVTESAKKPADQVIGNGKRKVVPESDSSDSESDILSGLAAIYSRKNSNLTTTNNDRNTGQNKGSNTTQMNDNINSDEQAQNNSVNPETGVPETSIPYPNIDQTSNLASEESNTTQNTSAISLDDQDDQEAFSDANNSLTEQVESAGQSSSANRRHQNISLPDIDQHARSRGIINPLASRDIGRSVGISDQLDE